MQPNRNSLRVVLALLASATLLSAAIASCGGSSSTLDDGGGDDSATKADSGSADAARGDSGDGDGSLSSSCPSTAPTDQSSCSSPGLQCEYGSFIELGCDTIATCTDGKWAASIASDCHIDIDAAACPGTRADVPENQACTDMGLECDYASGVCYCTVDHTGAPEVWTCFPTSGCPYPRPRLGQTCTTDAQQCDYSTCGASVVCQDGTWHTGNGGCHP